MRMRINTSEKVGMQQDCIVIGGDIFLDLERKH